MKKSLFICILIIICLIFPSFAHSEVLWEKELNTAKFIEPYADNLVTTGSLYECNGAYYILYFGMDSSTAKKVNYKWQGSKYPAIMKIDEDGKTLFRKEQALPLIDSLNEVGVKMSRQVRACRCQGNELLFDIPQVEGIERTPIFYRFSTIDGNLNSIEGERAYHYQPHQTQKAIISDDEEFVLADGLFTFNQSRIDVHNLFGDENHTTLKYRIILNMDAFQDSIAEGTYAMDFLMVDNQSFIVRYFGKNKKTIIAKYSYDKSAAANLETGQTLTSNLVWYTIYSTGGFQKFVRQDNKNLLILNIGNRMTILDNDGKNIFNKVIFDKTKYQNYTINDFIPLKYKPGYFAFWGYHIENSERNFAVIITDNDFNVVDAIHWDYNGKSNSLTDIKEKENGNLIVYGNSLYKVTNESGINNYYVPYYAEIRPNYTDVDDQAGNKQIGISPNPAGDFITITLQPSEGFNPSEGSEIQIYNTLGEKVMTESIHPMTASHRMNIEPLPRGIYFVKVGGETAKFVKM